MMKINIGKIFKTLISLIFLGLIWTNPLIMRENAQSNVKIFTDGINTLLSSLGIKYILLPKQIMMWIMIIEYFIFGIVLIIMQKSYTERIKKHVSIPLSIGLMTSIVTTYFGLFDKVPFGTLQDVIYQTEGLIFGILTYIIFDIMRSKNSGGRKYSSANYKRGR